MICISITDFNTTSRAPAASNYVQYFHMPFWSFVLSIKLLKPTCKFTCHQVQHPRTLYDDHTALCVLYGSQNKQQTFTLQH